MLSLCKVDKNIPDLPSWDLDFTNILQRVPLQQSAMDRKVVPVTAVLQPTFSASGDNPNISVSYGFMQTPPMSLLLHAKFLNKVECVHGYYLGRTIFPKVTARPKKMVLPRFNH